MFKSYLKLAYRNLFKNKLYAFINIFGLAVAIGCTMVVFTFVDDQYGRDSFHENGENIFLVGNIIDRNGNQQLWGDAPLPLGAAMEADFPQIKRVARVRERGGAFRYGDKVFNEGVWFVDPAFLDMFTFPLKEGEKEVLRDPAAIIISEEMATKYFGEESPIGKQVTISFQEEKVETFFVKGVAEKFSRKASFSFDVLITMDKLPATGVKDMNSWNEWARATFIEMHNPADLSILQGQMEKYMTLQHAVNQDWPIAGFTFDNLYNLSVNSHQVRGDISRGSQPTARLVLMIIGAALLLLACFNYMNIAIASATRRLKEIGIRKVVGGRQFQLIYQFLGENLLICLVALAIGVALGYSVFLPAFNSLFDGTGLELDLFGNMNAWLYFLGLLVFTAVVAGAYPAFFVSSFRPVAIFSGKLKITSKSLFTRVLLTIQFVFAFILISAAILFTQNSEYLKNMDWGYNQSQAIMVRLEGKKHYELYRDALQENPDIEMLAGSRNHFGRSWGTSVIEIAAKKHEVHRFDVGENYLETMGVPLKSGRNFDVNLKTDEHVALVNETFVKSMKWEDPLGQQFRTDSTLYSVIGVVSDFHYDNFHDAIEPTIFRIRNESDMMNFIAVRAKAGKVFQTADFMKSTWKKLFPDAPYNGMIQDEIYEAFYREETNISKLFSFIALVATMLSCMGLFGLVSLNIAKQMKEISIRKVLGASIVNIAHLVNRQFIWLIVIAVLVATPLGFVALNALLDDIYEYHIPIGGSPFLLAGLIFLVTALVTVSSQIYKAVVANPVDALRNE